MPGNDEIGYRRWRENFLDVTGNKTARRCLGRGDAGSVIENSHSAALHIRVSCERYCS
jgi:hypothetical protein